MLQWRMIFLLVPAIIGLTPMTARNQTGHYTWSVSASETDPFVNTGPVPNDDFLFFYLWFVEGCHPSPPGGMYSAEFKLATSPSWTIVGTFAQNSFLEAGPAPDPSGKNFILAVAGCPTGPVVARSMFLSSTNQPGRVDFTVTDEDFYGWDLNQVIATANCEDPPVLSEWPANMAVIGYATEGAGPHQLSGNGCTVGGPVSVESRSWGRMKALYR